MTIDELRAERKTLLQRKAELEAAGADPMQIQLVRERLLSVNSALRRMTPGHRIGAKKTNGNELASADRQQYIAWARSWGELEADGVTWAEYDTGQKIFREALREADAMLTEKEKRYFDLWCDGKRVPQIAEEYGVDKSSVYRKIGSARRKLNEAARHLRNADPEYDGPGIRLDVSEPETAKMLISALTPLQTVYLYLYYGEWLSCGEIGRLLDVDKTAALRGITRGIVSIGKMFPGKEILLDNVDALGDLAYALYLDRGGCDEPPEPDRRPPEPGPDWGRRKLGLTGMRPARELRYADRPPAVAATSFGDRQDVRELRQERVRAPRGRLLTALLERLRSSGKPETGALRRWLRGLFLRIKQAITPNKRKGAQ